METTFQQFVNLGFGWFIVILAITGYFLTLRRLGEKWVFWIVLATGWGFFALANTLIVTGISTAQPLIEGIWFSSFVLVVMSMAMLFIKLTQVRQRRQSTNQ
ncbi:MAG: hypothetical protein PHE50_05950 [Dehalococcoidales bacterium]|nr:hypothetical protein [Dehalococcoidales bacterium]